MPDQEKPNQEKPSFIPPEQARVVWLKSLENQHNQRRFYRSGFKDHDRRAGAFQRGGFYLVAARPGVGKTSLLLSLAYRQIKRGVKAYFANLEMTLSQMWNRLACLDDRTLTLRELLEEDLTPERIRYLTHLSEELAKFSPLFWENSEFLTFARAVKEVITPGSESILFVDYVGLFTMRGLGAQERYWLVSEVAKQLKLMARILDIPVIVAVQMNRKIEERKEKTPTLADLRDTGELENHADAVFALTRDGDRLDVDILKNRGGPLGTYSLRFDGPRAAVEEFDEL